MGDVMSAQSEPATLEAARAAIAEILRDLHALREQGHEPDLDTWRSSFFELADAIMGRTVQ